MAGKIKQVKGRIKESVGVLTGNRKLKIDGKIEQASGKIHEVAGKVSKKMDKSCCS